MHDHHDESASIQCHDFHDVTHLAKGLSNWEQSFDQISAGPFLGRVQEIRFDGLQLIREQINCAILKRTATLDDVMTFCIPLSVIGEGKCGRVTLNGNGIFISHGKKIPELRTSPVQDIVIAAIDTNLIARICDATNIDFSVTAPQVAILSAQRQAETAKWLTNVFSQTVATGELQKHPGLLKTLRDSIVLEVLGLFKSASRALYIDPSKRYKIIEQVRELAMSERQSPLTVLDACLAVGTSRRTLQSCFDEMLGIPPAVYVRMARLNAARRELRRADPAITSVTDIATKWGFWHLGRFSANYRDLFGELPSHTLSTFC